MALVYDPTAPSHNRPRELGKLLGDLNGRTVGFIDNAKPNFNFLVDDLAELLVAKYGVKTIVKRAKRGASMPAPEAYVADLAQQCDLVITGSGD
jgi:hypothetical protein